MKYFILLSLLLSCGKIVESPYVDDISNLKINNKVQIPSKFPIKISIITDSHNNYDELNDFIDQNNSDLIILNGDFTNLGLAKEFELFLEIIKNQNIIVLAGNHDLLNNGEKLFSKAFGLFNFNFNIGNYKFHIINNNNWESSSKNYYNKKELEESVSEDQVNFLFSHVSMIDRDRFNYQEGLDLMKKFDVSFNGHDHIYGESFFDDTRKITIGSLNGRYYIELILHKDHYSINRVPF